MYRVGGFALVFIFTGVIAMLVGNFYKSELSSWIFGIGAFLTIVCLGLFVYTQLQGPVKASRLVRENKEMIDAVQEVALELTRTTGAVQALTFKHIKQVDKIIDSTVPFLAMIPTVGKKLEESGLADARNVSKVIVDISTQAETLIQDVESALVNADAKKLRSYSKELKKITKILRETLATASARKGL